MLVTGGAGGRLLLVYDGFEQMQDRHNPEVPRAGTLTDFCARLPLRFGADAA